MRVRFLLAAAASILSGVAVGAETPPPGADGCVGCHGPAGRASTLPSLAGRSAEEIAASMRAFRDGSRPNVLMGRIARGFDAAETAAIAAWLAGGDK